jgi:hypothetical protein
MGLKIIYKTLFFTYLTQSKKMGYNDWIEFSGQGTSGRGHVLSAVHYPGPMRSDIAFWCPRNLDSRKLDPTRHAELSCELRSRSLAGCLHVGWRVSRRYRDYRSERPTCYGQCSASTGPWRCRRQCGGYCGWSRRGYVEPVGSAAVGTATVRLVHTPANCNRKNQT